MGTGLAGPFQTHAVRAGSLDCTRQPGCTAGGVLCPQVGSRPGVWYRISPHHPLVPAMDGGHDFRRQTVVDFGCGSGVLGIAAAIKGAAKVICVDNDPQALIATRDNASRNNVADKIHALMPAQFKPAQADVLLANILAGPLLDLAPVLLASLRVGGSMVLSGILEEQTEEVAEAYRLYMDHLTVTADDGWVRLHGQKSEPCLSTHGSGQ